ncbi:ribonuclease P/MRP protein subunit POP5 [Vanessa atalanta]|uniref:ribonuclease P/MRP protein subunit POP5 n=1 Tax=Vanessa atalanta TaxID=42275 RepID=UPI001FCD0AA8|nr:ribonuclease P/MRP protein subunit POP5 [Vanessa atalanta]
MVRFKNRYITVEIVSPTVPEYKALSLKSKLFNDMIFEKIQQLHGDFGVAAVKNGFLTKYCNENTRIAIIRSRHGPHRFVTSSLPFITRIGKLEVSLKTLHVGATLKHSFKFIQNHQRLYLENMWSKLRTDEERNAFEVAVKDFTKTDISLNIERIAYFIFLF